MTVHDDLVTLRLIGLTYEEQAALARVEAEIARLEQRAEMDRESSDHWLAVARENRQRAEAAEAEVARLTRERDAVTSECERLCDENDRMAADNARLRDGLRKIAVCFTAVQAVEIARALLANQDGAA